MTLDERTEDPAVRLKYQMSDDALNPDAKLGRNGDRTLASLYDLKTADKPPRFVHPIGGWNAGRVVVCPNNHVEHYLNGAKVPEYERGSPECRNSVAQSKYHVWPNAATG